MDYETIIGLETHVELSTESKIFCSCGGHAAAKEPNDCICPACAGMPGMLPVMNKRVIELAILAGLMLNCEISRYTTFDKKNYYYPDLPCAYQVTQLNHPICKRGHVTVKTPTSSREIRINRIHMEEDAGKLVHKGKYSLVDFNRTSVPLIEIVTEPDFRSAEEVIAYLTKLKVMFRSCGISECERGAMRCDVNISVRPVGTTEFGVRTEVKNMSSFEAILKAIEYEVQRHIDAIEYETEELVQETRRFDDASGKTFAMRDKETAADYRYFPDPNLMPMVIDDEWLERIKAKKPIEVDDKVTDFLSAGITQQEIDMILTDSRIGELFDKTVLCGCDKREVATWILTDYFGILSRLNLTVDSHTLSAEKLATIIKMVNSGEINRGAGKAILAAVVEFDVDPIAYCTAQGYNKKVDEKAIKEAIAIAIDTNPKAVSDYKSGKEKAFQSLLGACMKLLKGAGDPTTIKALLLEALNSI